MKVVYIKRNYQEMVDLLELPSDFYAPQTKEDYDKQMNLDLPRMSYALVHPHTVSEIQTNLRDTSDLYDEKEAHLLDEARPLSFTQGVYEGRVLVSYLFSEKFILGRSNSHQNGASLALKAFTCEEFDRLKRLTPEQWSCLAKDNDDLLELIDLFNKIQSLKTENDQYKQVLFNNKEIFYLNNLLDDCSLTELSRKLVDEWERPDTETSMCYVDDEGRENGLCVFAVRDDTTSLPPAKAPDHLFYIVVIQDVKKAPIDRTVHILAHSRLLPDSLQEILESGDHPMPFQEIEAEVVPEILHEVMHSKFLSREILSGLFQEDSVVLSHIKAFNTRLICGQNIDDRDMKLAKLHEILRESAFDTSTHIRKKSKKLAYVGALIKAASEDMNFFKSVEMEALETLQQSLSEGPLPKNLELGPQLSQETTRRLVDLGRSFEREETKIEKRRIKKSDKLHDPEFDSELERMYVSRRRWDFVRLALAVGSAKLNPLVGFVAITSQVSEMRDKETRLSNYQQGLKEGIEKQEEKARKKMGKLHRLFDKRVREILDPMPERTCASMDGVSCSASSISSEAGVAGSSSHLVSASDEKIWEILEAEEAAYSGASSSASCSTSRRSMPSSPFGFFSKSSGGSPRGEKEEEVRQASSPPSSP